MDDGFDLGGSPATAERIVPWGLLTWVWAAAVVLPPLGMLVSVWAFCRMYRHRRFLTGLWVPVAGFFTAAMLSAALVGYYVHGREIERRDAELYRECRGNVEAIAAAISRYVADNGRPPGSLDELDAARFPGGRLPICPAAVEGEGPGYVYRPDLYRQGDGYRIILYDSGPRHMGCRVVARQDGRVEWYAEESFVEILANPAEAVRESILRRRNAAAPREDK